MNMKQFKDINPWDKYILYSRSYMWNDDGRIYPLITSNNLEELNIIGQIYCYKDNSSPVIYEHNSKVKKFDSEYNTPELQYRKIEPINKQPKWYSRIHSKMPKYLKKCYKLGIYKQKYLDENMFKIIKLNLINLYLERQYK